jgi:hypothetical protein
MVTRRGPNESYARRANAALSDAESAGVSRGLRQILLGLKNPLVRGLLVGAGLTGRGSCANSTYNSTNIKARR